MSFLDDAIPPPRRQVNTSASKSKISTAYVSDVPSFYVVEATPEIVQNEFDAIFNASSTAGLFHNESISESSTSKGKRPVNTPPASIMTANDISSPPHSRHPSIDTTPKPSPSRRASIPIRKSPARLILESSPIKMSCDNCRSLHTISISESDRISIHSCNVTPPPPTPVPSILELYRLPGFLKLNESGQIVVHTEAEIFSYVRKIFAKSSNFQGDFPDSRKYCIGTFDSPLSPMSWTSTPESARASFALGHSEYKGTFGNSATRTKQSSVAASAAATNAAPTQPSSPRSQSRGPLEPYIPSPSSPGSNRSRASSVGTSGTAPVMAFVQEVVPSDTTSFPPSSPRHASAARRASPRNLRPLGITSDSEVDLPIPSLTEFTNREMKMFMPSRSPSRSRRDLSPVLDSPAEIYNRNEELSRELSTETRSNRSRSPYQTPPQESSVHRRY